MCGATFVHINNEGKVDADSLLSLNFATKTRLAPTELFDTKVPAAAGVDQCLNEWFVTLWYSHNEGEDEKALVRDLAYFKAQGASCSSDEPQVTERGRYFSFWAFPNISNFIRDAVAKNLKRSDLPAEHRSLMTDFLRFASTTKNMKSDLLL